jgi:hypothetical protein
MAAWLATSARPVGVESDLANIRVDEDDGDPIPGPEIRA